MEGRSMVPVFRGEALTRGKRIFWEHEGNRAVRDGKWKLVAGFQKPWQLFDMAADRTEMHDLAAKEPDRVRQMAGQWAALAARSYVDAWSDADDSPLNGRERQIWGDAETPQLPHAHAGKSGRPGGVGPGSVPSRQRVGGTRWGKRG